MNQDKYNIATDCTNAYIVGGLIGEAVGVNGIPQQMRDSVLDCDTTKGKYPRPAFLPPHYEIKMESIIARTEIINIFTT